MIKTIKKYLEVWRALRELRKLARTQKKATKKQWDKFWKDDTFY